jgi:uridine kinase
MIETSRVADAPEYRRTARDLIAQLERLCDLEGACSERRLVIGVAGESGSGKSVTAVALARELVDLDVPTDVLHQDDYFLRPPRVNHAHRERDLAHVGPHEVNLALMAHHVAEFRAGRPVGDAPLVDYPNDRFLTRRLDFAPLAVLVVEGTYALMLDDLDVRVFIEATHEDTAERRRSRNRDVDAPFVRDVLQIEHEIIARQAAAAHLVVDRDFAVRRGPAAR